MNRVMQNNLRNGTWGGGEFSNRLEVKKQSVLSDSSCNNVLSVCSDTSRGSYSQIFHPCGFPAVENEAGKNTRHSPALDISKEIRKKVCTPVSRQQINV